MIRRVAVVVFALIAVVGVGCGSSNDNESSDESSGPFTVGFAVDKSSFLEPYDRPAQQAAEIEIDRLNQDGGLLGRQIDTTDADTKSDPVESANAGVQVLEDGADLMVTTCDFDTGGPAARQAQQRGVIAFSTCAGSLKFGLVGIGDLAFTMGVPGFDEGSIMAEFAYNDQKYRTAYTLTDTTIDYEKQLCDGLSGRFEELGGTISGADTFQQDDQSIAAQISKLKSGAEPDFIFMCSYMPGEAKAVRQIRSAGIDVPILGGQDFDGEFWKKAVPGLSDVYYTSYASIYGDDPDEEVNKFFGEFKTRYGDVPETGSAITGYQAMEAYAKAAEEADSTDGDAVRDALESFDHEQLLGVDVTFTPEDHINLTRPMRIMQIQDGTTTFHSEGIPEKVFIPTDE